MKSSTVEPEELEKRHLALGDTDPTGVEEETKPFGAVILIALLALLLFAGGANIFFTTVGFIVMIFLHELGHFMTARWTGMKATQFFIGFGRTIFSFKRGETTYGVKAIPAGAFVRILGMHNLDPVDPVDEPRAYRNKSYPKRMLVITAGSMMHFIQALLLFVLLFGFVGIPEIDESSWTVREATFLDDADTVQSPAQQAGISEGDAIIEVDGINVTEWEDLRDVVGSRANETVVISGTRADGSAFTETVTLAVNPSDSTRGFIGVRPEFAEVKVTPGVVEGVKEFGYVMYQSTLGLPRIFTPNTVTNLGSQVASPTGEVSITSEEANRPLSVLGLVRLANDVNPLLLLAYANAFIGLFNLLPVLPLDGGHAAIATYERVRSRKDRRYQADFAKALPMTYVVIALLGFIFITTIYLDIFSPVTGN